MQVYRGMDIGTAKPTAAERAEIPHHLLDLVEPSEEFTLARFAVELSAGLRLRQARKSADQRRLSAAERSVLQLLASGASDKEIALALRVGLSTVSTCATGLSERMGIPFFSIASLLEKVSR